MNPLFSLLSTSSHPPQQEGRISKPPLLSLLVSCVQRFFAFIPKASFLRKQESRLEIIGEKQYELDFFVAIR
jgi:hypothetical protein